MNKSSIRYLLVFIFAGALAGYSGTASAAAFAVNTPSTQAMGNAVAGGGAIAEDASAVWMNPASITRLPSQAMSSFHVILPTFDFTDSGTTFSPAVGGGAVSGPATIDGSEEAFVPNFYYIRTLSESLSFGLAVNAPFGLATDYSRTWTGRYHAVESEIIDFNVNPALAWKVNEVFSVGAGVSLNYIDAKLSNVVDFGTFCAVTPFPACGGPGGADGFVENKADDISFGYNFGFFYEPTDRTRFSLAYRSQINHKLDGKADFSGAAAAGLSTVFFDDGIKVGASLPDSVSFSAFHMLTPKIGIMGDVTWTGWSDIPELRIVFDSPTNGGGSGTSSEDLQWEDVWRFGLGLNYYYNNRLTLRTGVAYDESPVPNLTLRTPRLPDNDRIWLSIGASYGISEKLSVDFAYAHEFIDDTNIARSTSLGTVLRGTYESDVDIISLQVSYLFD